MVKPRLYNKEDETRNAALWTLKTVLINALKLLHPYMPFITEEIFMHVQNTEESIMISDWPVFKQQWDYKENEKEIDVMKEAVKTIRNIRAEMNVVPSKKAKVFIVSEDSEIQSIFEKSQVFFKTLAYASEVMIQKDKTEIEDNAVSAIIHNATIYMPFAELIDIEKEVERLSKEKEKMQNEIERVEKKLGNESFVAKAPQKVVKEEKQKMEKYKTMLLQIEERLNQMK